MSVKVKGYEMTQKTQFIEIKLSKYVLFLTEIEIKTLLSLNPSLWEEAIRRGKSIKRARVGQARNNKVPGSPIGVVKG
ncbi:hypothetical protein [Pelotomaculum sp. FP]|uniref:hypothetical protein n=1 Tax=Pelotomaculum sp. FP TaxID=261474 RepID=UPI001065D1F3|nr:hypothetical protein [Pelotomaculum sp. FP]